MIGNYATVIGFLALVLSYILSKVTDPASRLFGVVHIRGN